jgi:hypothetical protein
MSEESKKIEKTEKTGQKVNPAELSDKDLEQVAGGAVSPDPESALVTHKGGPIKYSGS